MKKLLTVIIIFFMAFFSAAGNVFAQTNDPTFLDYTGNFHNDIVAPQVRAWKAMAQVIYPRVCDDTETEWAVQKMDSLSNIILGNPNMPKAEQLAMLYEIENYAAYGMSYVVSLIAMTANPEIGEQLTSILPRSNKMLGYLKKDNYNNAILLTEYEEDVYDNFLGMMIVTSQYSNGKPEFINNLINALAYDYQAVDDLYNKVKNKTNAFRNSVLVNNTSFFMTFFNLTYILAGSEFIAAHQDEYQKIGGWIDRQSHPVLLSLDDPTMMSIKVFSDDEFSGLWKESIGYRTRIIQLMAQGIETLPLS